MSCLRCIVWLLSLFCLFQASPAQAKPQPSEQELAKLAESVDKANKLFEEKKYQQALPLYQDVYTRSKEPTMLFSIGQCYRNLGQFELAARSYEAFLKEAPQNQELRPLAQQLLTEAQEKLPKPDPPKKLTPRKLYLTAGATGALSLSTGVASLITIVLSEKQEDLGEDAKAEDLAKLAQVLALTADVSGGVSLGFAIGGFVLSKKEKKTTTSLYLGPTQAILALEF
jgi:tetratricopeptide (TPR) repeat protein